LLALPLERFAPLLGDEDLRAADERLLEPVPDDFARDDFFAPPLEREPLERDPLDRELLEREPEAADLRGDDLRDDDLRELPRDDDEDDEPLTPLTTDSTSAVHLPDNTRCAASATASAMSEPSFVALAATLLAAC
jgi:hypothetical protein